MFKFLDHHMSSLKYLGVLGLIYVAIWGGIFGINMLVDIKTSPAGFLISAIAMSLAFFYPAWAVGRFFHYQTQACHFKWLSYFTLACATLFFSWVFIDLSDGGGQSYDALKYVIFGIAGGCLLALINMVPACISKNQTPLTRALIFTGLVLILATPILVLTIGFPKPEFYLPENFDLSNPYTIICAGLCLCILAIISAGVSGYRYPAKSDERETSL